MTPAERATAAALGWPWDRLAAAQDELNDARRAMELALEAGDPADRDAAEFGLRAARGRWHHCRDQMADVFLALFDAALKYAPEAVFGKVMAFAAANDWREGVRRYMAGCAGSAQHLLWTFGQIEQRLAALAAEAEQLRAENWELAREVAAMRGGHRGRTA